MKLIKQVEVNVGYILLLVEQWREDRGNGSDVEMTALMNIQRAIGSGQIPTHPSAWPLSGFTRC